MSNTKELSITGPLPPSLLLVTLVAMVVVHFLLPLDTLDSQGWRWLGLFFFASGIAINIWANQQFKLAQTAVKPTEPSTSLVIAGPFAYSRNPMYLGMVSTLVGTALALGSVTPWLLIPIFIWRITDKFITPEERKMESTFGEQYLAYQRKVRRWL